MKRTGRKNSTIICLMGIGMILSLGCCTMLFPIEGRASSGNVKVSVVESAKASTEDSNAAIQSGMTGQDNRSVKEGNQQKGVTVQKMQETQGTVQESTAGQPENGTGQAVQVQVLDNGKDQEKQEAANYGTVREENARNVFLWNLAIFVGLPLTLILVPELIAEKMALHREEKNLWKYPQPGVYTLYECKKIAGIPESVGRGTGKKSSLRQIRRDKFSKR